MKRTTALELMLPVRDPETPAYRWLYTALRTEILEGRLRRRVRVGRAHACKFSLARSSQPRCAGVSHSGSIDAGFRGIMNHEC